MSSIMLCTTKRNYYLFTFRKELRYIKILLMLFRSLLMKMHIKRLIFNEKYVIINFVLCLVWRLFIFKIVLKELKKKQLEICFNYRILCLIHQNGYLIKRIFLNVCHSKLLPYIFLIMDKMSRFQYIYSMYIEIMIFLA